MEELFSTYLKERDSEKLLNLLQDQPKLLDQADQNGASGLMQLAYHGMKEVLEAAISMKKEFEFHEAIICGKEDIVQEFLNQKGAAYFNAYSPDGFSPLSLAAFFNQTEIAKLLVAKGSDPSLAAWNPSRVNALHSAVAKENLDLCTLFVKNGVDVNAPQTQGVTALHSAVHRGNIAISQLLLENGAKPDARMDNGDTPIRIAEKEGHTEILQLLSSEK